MEDSVWTYGIKDSVWAYGMEESVGTEWDTVQGMDAARRFT